MCRFDIFRFIYQADAKRDRHELLTSPVETRSNTSSLHVLATGFKNKYECVFGSVRYELVYLKDSKATAHSVDSDIFYAVIYLQLHA